MLRADLQAHLQWAQRFILRWQRSGATLDDLKSAAATAVLAAAQRHDPTKSSFRHYAVHWLRREAAEAARHAGAVSISRYVTNRLFMLRRTHRALANRLQREPTGDELARDLGWPLHVLHDVQHAAWRHLVYDPSLVLDDTTKPLDCLDLPTVSGETAAVLAGYSFAELERHAPGAQERVWRDVRRMVFE